MKKHKRNGARKFRLTKSLGRIWRAQKNCCFVCLSFFWACFFNLRNLLGVFSIRIRHLINQRFLHELALRYHDFGQSQYHLRAYQNR